MTSIDNVVKLRQPKQEFNFTEARLNKAQHIRKKQRLIDSKTKLNLYIEPLPSTTKTFYTYKTFRGKPKQIKIGRLGEISLADARRIHQENSILLSKGIDPTKQTQESAYKTVRELATEVIEVKSKSGNHSPKTTTLYKRLLNQGIISEKILSSSFEELNKEVLEQWYLGLRNKMHGANNSLKLLQIAFNRLPEHQKRIIESPKSHLKDVLYDTNSITKKEQYINPDPSSGELGRVFHSAVNKVFGYFATRFTEHDLVEAGHEVPKDFKPYDVWDPEPSPHFRVQFDAFMFILLTGVRADNCYQLTWDDVDFDEGRVRIDKIKLKKEPLYINFTNQLCWLLDWRYLKRDSSKWVFPSNVDNQKHISTIRDFCDYVSKYSGTKQRVTPHSVRRTLGNVSNYIGHGKEIQDAILHHVPTDVGSKHYVNRIQTIYRNYQECHDFIDNRFAELALAEQLTFSNHPLIEDKEGFSSVFGLLYGHDHIVKKDNEFYSNSWEPRVKEKTYVFNRFDES